MESTVELIKVEPINTSKIHEDDKNVIVLTDRATQLIITDQVGYETAGTLLKEIKSVTDDLTKKRIAITKPLDVAKKAVMDLFRTPLSRLENAENTVKRAMIKYADDQEKARLETERLERERIKKEEEKLNKKAEKAEEKGDLTKADELRAKAGDLAYQAPVVAPTAETPKGISMRDDWYAEVTNLAELCRAVVEGKASITFIQPDMTALNKQAKSTKNNWALPGVAFKCRRVVASRKA